jgi:hypothetical protein
VSTLQLNVSKDLLEQIQRLAEDHRQTVHDEAVRLLCRGLQNDTAEKSQAELLADLRPRSFTPAPGTPDSVELLREDRGR